MADGTSSGATYLGQQYRSVSDGPSTSNKALCGATGHAAASEVIVTGQAGSVKTPENPRVVAVPYDASPAVVHPDGQITPGEKYNSYPCVGLSWSLDIIESIADPEGTQSANGSIEQVGGPRTSLIAVADAMTT